MDYIKDSVASIKLTSSDLKEGDLFVLFSDGLKEETAEEILLKSKRQNISHAFEQLVQHNSFQDDTTVLLAEIFER